jgi:hypothetical protein
MSPAAAVAKVPNGRRQSAILIAEPLGLACALDEFTVLLWKNSKETLQAKRSTDSMVVGSVSTDQSHRSVTNFDAVAVLDLDYMPIERHHDERTRLSATRVYNCVSFKPNLMLASFCVSPLGRRFAAYSAKRPIS